MSRAWRVIITIVLIAILFATVCVGVALLTGADFSRVYSVFNNKYNVEMAYGRRISMVFESVLIINGPVMQKRAAAGLFFA